MPVGLRRFQHSGQSHFVTFTCYHRQPSFNSPEVYGLFVEILERTRRRFALCVYGYVVMPEHVHLLISEPGRATERRVGVCSLDSHLGSTVAQVRGDSLNSNLGSTVAQVRGDSLNSNLGSTVAQVRGRSLAANLGSLADSLHYLKLSFTKQLHSRTGFAGSFWQKRYYSRNVRDEREFTEKLRYLHRNPVKAGLCKLPEEWQWSSFRSHAYDEPRAVRIDRWGPVVITRPAELA